MRKVFVVLSTLLLLAIVVQFFLAGMGAFDSGSRDESFATHRAFGYGILLFAVILTVVAAAARLPGRLIGTTGLVAGLVLLQVVIAELAGALDNSGGTTSTTAKLVFGLHAVNAVAVGITAGRVVNQARTLTPSRSDAQQEQPARPSR